MAASIKEIREWILNGVNNKCTHMIVAVDTWNYEDYPIYIKEEESVLAWIDRVKRGENRVMEVYNLRIDLDTQLGERRAWNI